MRNPGQNEQFGQTILTGYIYSLYTNIIFFTSTIDLDFCLALDVMSVLILCVHNEGPVQANLHLFISANLFYCGYAQATRISSDNAARRCVYTWLRVEPLQMQTNQSVPIFQW